MKLLLLLLLVNLPAFAGLAYVLFRDWNDFIESLQGVLARDVVGYGSFVPTRAWWFIVLCISLLGSEYYAISKWKPQWLADHIDGTTWVLMASLL